MTTHPHPCPCTLVQQDESCPVGYPSLLCDRCDGKGHLTEHEDPTLRPFQRPTVTGATIQICCPGCNGTTDLELTQCLDAGWEADSPDRWIDCPHCDALLDAGFGCNMEPME